MASARFSREKHKLKLTLHHLQGDRQDELLLPGPNLVMLVTNLRNRPLDTMNAFSISSSILSLYHNLVTGSKDFPSFQFMGLFTTLYTVAPFGTLYELERENTLPSTLEFSPPGVMVPPAGSSSFSANMLTPVLPERADLAALKVDPRNKVLEMESDGLLLTRVISTVYRSDHTELTNRWRVTDYSTDGHLLMSVLCQFDRQSAIYAVTPVQRKRKDAEEDSSSQSPPKKRLRL